MRKLIVVALCVISMFSLIGCSSKTAKVSVGTKVGTWKTAQTIQPFFYQDYLESEQQVEVIDFTNPGDMKTALLAGSLDLCGTTMVTAITATSKGEPVVVVSGLSNKCSAKNVWLDQAVAFGTDRKVLDVAANNIELFWYIDENYIESVKDLAQRMKEQGLISEIPDIDKMFDLSFIKQAEKELK